MKIVKGEDDKVRVILENLEEFQTTGVLWYLNRVAFHPRGMALGFGNDEEGNFIVEVWGNCDEPWTMPEEADNIRFLQFEELIQAIKKAVASDHWCGLNEDWHDKTCFCSCGDCGPKS